MTTYLQEWNDLLIESPDGRLLILDDEDGPPSIQPPYRVCCPCPVGISCEYLSNVPAPVTIHLAEFTAAIRRRVWGLFIVFWGCIDQLDAPGIPLWPSQSIPTSALVPGELSVAGVSNFWTLNNAGPALSPAAPLTVAIDVQCLPGPITMDCGGEPYTSESGNIMRVRAVVAPLCCVHTDGQVYSGSVHVTWFLSGTNASGSDCCVEITRPGPTGAFEFIAYRANIPIVISSS